MVAQFDPRSQNNFFQVMAKAMSGSFTLQASFDGDALTLKLMLPDIPFSAEVMLTQASLDIGAKMQPPAVFVGVSHLS